LGTVFDNLGDRKKAIECHERGLKIALDNGLFEAALRAYNNLAVALPTEEAERSRENIEKGYELARKIGHIHLQSFMGTNLAWYHLGTGDVGKALALAEESVGLDRKASNMVNLSFSLGTLALVYFILGDWDRCEEYVGENIRIAEKVKDRQQSVGSYSWLGFLHFSKGEFLEAKTWYEKAYGVDEKAGAKVGQMATSVNLIWMLIELGELERANSLLDKLYEFALDIKNSELVVWADARKGMVFRAEKKWDDAIEYFEKSIREAEALGFRKYRVYEFARMFLSEYARVYLERNHEGDREKAHSILNEALEMFERMGAKKEIENIIAKKKLLTA
jgi:tetratricopeptide (TPR) repeat protein